jgi:CRISPR-associated protein Csy3
MAKNQLTASVLAFDRRLSSSNAIFYGVDWKKRGQSKGRPLPVMEKSVRGVIDHRLKGNQESQTHVEADIENANPQRVDYCTLGMDEDTLRVRFNVQVAGKIEPCACNNQEVARKVNSMVEQAAGENIFSELCRRYTTNLANGRFLWRNRLGAENIEIKISMNEEDFDFDALSFKPWEFDETNENINKIGKNMVEVLTGAKSHVNLCIDACVKKFPGLEVFPSQELVIDKSRDKSRGRKSKFLFEAETETGKAAALHPQKVTNAIHTIDNWYSKEDVHPISVNAYGAVTNQGRAYRQPKENDFYTLFDKAVAQGIESIEPDARKYVMAMLVRGGVFGKGD